MSDKIKIAAAHPPNWRHLSYKIEDEAEVLRLVDVQIDRIMELADEAANAGAIAVAYPEDMLGLLAWQMAHLDTQRSVLETAVDKLLGSLSEKAKERSIYFIACNDMPNGDAISNTAVLIGRDGSEIGRYHKINQPFAERWKKSGTTYPVFETDDLGTVGLAICYDMVFPEVTRALALGGADLVFDLSMGGASMASGEEANRAAFMTRAGDNGVYLIHVSRGNSMFVSPEAVIFSQASKGEKITFGEFDPIEKRGATVDDDKRARIFAERMTGTYGILTDPNPPVLEKLGTDKLLPVDTYVTGSARALTTGEECFKTAEELVKEGKKGEAIRAFEQMVEEYRTTWVASVSLQRLEELKGEGIPAD